MPDALELTAVFREHHDLVWRCLRGFGVDPAVVDDAVQDVFMIVHRRQGDYDGHAPVRRWVLGIARNVALKYRARTARTLGQRHVAPAEELDALPSPASPAPDEAVAAREAAQLVDRFVDGLPPDQRAVFVLSEVEGMTGPEISELLGVKLNTVYSRLRVVRGSFDQAVARHRAAARRHACAR
jgi:RNA polymerase sigma-70 factor, ECF subfamily